MSILSRLTGPWLRKESRTSLDPVFLGSQARGILRNAKTLPDGSIEYQIGLDQQLEIQQYGNCITVHSRNWFLQEHFLNIDGYHLPPVELFFVDFPDGKVGIGFLPENFLPGEVNDEARERTAISIAEENKMPRDQFEILMSINSIRIA